MAARLLEELERVIGALEVVPGANGIFDVHVDGELVFEKKMLGRYPEPDDVLPLVRAAIGA
ncbi:MAG: Rdx family protein [Thermoleophilia bacterium]|nr:Rdx family protein [Thermoleophilia bacterium]MDH4344849.1 Rdx family protein [Thermoleophilia bacterium]